MSLNIMISYPSERVAEAREIFDYLRKLGLSVWFDRESLVAGDDWNREIAAALAAAELFVVVCSKETVSKVGVVQRELHGILELLKDRPLGQNYIVNVLAEDVALPPELSRFQWIMMDRDDWRRDLLRAVLKKFGQLERQPIPAIEKALASSSTNQNVLARSIILQDGGAEYSCSYPSYPAVDDYWIYINSQIIASVYESYYGARLALGYYGSEEFGSTRNGALGWSLVVDEYFRTDDLLSLRFVWFQNNGGAHPSRGTFTLNFGGRDCGRVNLNELISYGSGAIDHIKKYCEMDIKRQSFAIGQIFDVDLLDYAPDANIENLFKEFNFSNKGIMFNLSELTGLPFVLGTYEIHMPWDFFRDKIDERFKNNDLSRLISADEDPEDKWV